ncbi:FAD-dependent monooxygenase [Paenibacillus sp. FSL H7-0690]|uniref:FAD-dependent monooxygenase n=1 Tax=Paenibacillus sp. FSL H7-0690 TaxID=2921437 RepID=UPI0030EDCCEC
MSDFSNFIGLPYSSDCVQIGFTMRKDQWNSIKSKGIEPLKLEFIKAFPELKEDIEKIIDFKSFVSIQSETFMVDNWHNKGCILIGDSAHCSSPLGAIGLSLAFETALVAAELIVASKLEPNHEYKCLDRLQPIRNREIRFVHFAQQLIISMTVKSPKGVKKFSLACMKLMGNSRIARYLMRRFFLGSPKITVDNAFKF